MPALPASALTRTASTQTYLTIRLLADRQRTQDAYRAYAYFRWVDDTLDAPAGSAAQRSAFLQRQELLLQHGLQGRVPAGLRPQETWLVELLQHDPAPHSGLRLYLRNMMRVMAFDVQRRGRLISQAELSQYTRWLASAVTECIHYFVGQQDFAPQDATRYLAVSGAHIAHMLRDTFDDAQLGYYNIPQEVLQAHGLGPLEVDQAAYRGWVQSRVELAREYLRAGKGYFARVENRRCRLACYGYIARFEWLLDTLEREGYRLRPQYDERKRAPAALHMAWATLASALNPGTSPTGLSPIASQRRSKS